MTVPLNIPLFHETHTCTQKYMVEAYYEKEQKVDKKRSYYNKLVKQPWGVVDYYPPKERQDYERIKNLSKQKWIRKFPPLAVLGEDTYKRLKNHAQVEYFAHGVEDFALHLPQELTPSRRVLVLRYKNRFDTLVRIPSQCLHNIFTIPSQYLHNTFAIPSQYLHNTLIPSQYLHNSISLFLLFANKPFPKRCKLPPKFP